MIAARFVASLCLVGAALAPVGVVDAKPQPKAQPPKLIVFMAIDGLPQRQVLAYRDQLAPDGFNRLLKRGSWFANAHYGHAHTVTGAGHATMLTGAYPHRTGIISNEWRDAQTGAREYCAGDTTATYIGHATNALDGTSPKNLKVETVGDVLRRAHPQSKVIAISGKDRGAILPAGKTGTAYMYMGSTGQLASTTYYMQEHPAWVTAFNSAKPADRYFRSEWKAVLPEAAYARSVTDNQPWFGPAGGGLPPQRWRVNSWAKMPRQIFCPSACRAMTMSTTPSVPSHVCRTTMSCTWTACCKASGTTWMPRWARTSMWWC